jgi:hypothetical protein
LSGGGVKPGATLATVVAVGGNEVFVAVGSGVEVGGMEVGDSTSNVAVSIVTSGVEVGMGGNSPVGIALVVVGISVRIFATRVAISESLTGGGVAVVNGSVQALSNPNNVITIIIRNQFFECIRLFSFKTLLNLKKINDL